MNNEDFNNKDKIEEVIENELFGDTNEQEDYEVDTFSSFSSVQQLSKKKFEKLQVKILKKHKVKIDLNTTLESFLGCSGCLVIFVSIFVAGELGFQFFLAGLIISAILFYAFKKTDNYYIFDLNNRTLYYHFKFFNKERLTRKASLEGNVALAINCVKKTSKSSKWWEYFLVFITESGEFIKLSDNINEKYFDKLNSESEYLAKCLNLKFYPGKLKHAIKIEKTGLSEYRLIYTVAK